MSQTLDLHDDVTHFVDLVRIYLGDLDAETIEELTGGLAADLSALHEDRGHRSLPDPEEYADELRFAAGLPTRGRAERAARPAWLPRIGWDGIDGWLDATRDLWCAATKTGWAAKIWGAVAALQPGWWVMRAWVAVELLDQILGDDPHDWLPAIYGQVVGAGILLSATVVSIQIGRGVWWPGRGRNTRRRQQARVALLGANVVALVALAPTIHLVRDHIAYYGVDGFYDRGYAEPVNDGLRQNGRRVCNITPYDAEGNLLAGVQLFDQAGRPLESRCGPGADGFQRYPATLADGTSRWNVFPQAEREQRKAGVGENAYESSNPPASPSGVPLRQQPVILPDSGPTTSR